MKQYMILVLVGKDRPGIVDEVSTFLFEKGANMEDSKMAGLGGRFCVLSLFSAAPEHMAEIKERIHELGERGLEVSLHPAEAPPGLGGQGAPQLRMQVVAMDHPGIVQKVVRILHDSHVNIQSLTTHVTPAPLSGAPLFDLLLDAQVPEGVSMGTVKERLHALAAQEDLDLRFFT